MEELRRGAREIERKAQMHSRPEVCPLPEFSFQLGIPRRLSCWLSKAQGIVRRAWGRKSLENGQGMHWTRRMALTLLSCILEILKMIRREKRV